MTHNSTPTTPTVHQLEKLTAPATLIRKGKAERIELLHDGKRIDFGMKASLKIGQYKYMAVYSYAPQVACITLRQHMAVDNISVWVGRDGWEAQLDAFRAKYEALASDGWTIKDVSYGRTTRNLYARQIRTAEYEKALADARAQYPAPRYSEKNNEGAGTEYRHHTFTDTESYLYASCSVHSRKDLVPGNCIALPITRAPADS